MIRDQDRALEFLIDPAKRHLKPHPLFDSSWYLATYPDVAQSRFNPLEHYLYFGSAEGRSPKRERRSKQCEPEQDE